MKELKIFQWEGKYPTLAGTDGSIKENIFEVTVEEGKSPEIRFNGSNISIYEVQSLVRWLRKEVLGDMSGELGVCKNYPVIAFKRETDPIPQAVINTTNPLVKVNEVFGEERNHLGVPIPIMEGRTAVTTKLEIEKPSKIVRTGSTPPMSGPDMTFIG